MQTRLTKRVLSMLLALALLVPQGLSALHRAEAAAASNVVLQQSFEDGQPGGWEKLSWGGAGDVSVTSDTASEGGKSLKFTNRASRNSSLSLNLTGLLQSDRFYDISYKVKVGSGSDSLHLASKVVSGGKDSYPWIIGNKTVSAGAWTSFELKNYQVPSSTGEFRIWVESDSTSTSTADFYVDEVLIKDVTPPAESPTTTVLSQSFEDSQLGGWEKLSWGGAGDVSVTKDTASEGGKSVKFTNRASRNSSLSNNLTGLLQSDRFYDISFKVKVGSGSDSLHLASKVVSGGKESYPWIIGNKTVSADAWTTFELKNYQVPPDTSEFRVWIESDSTSTSTADFYLDEVLIKDVTPAGPGGGEEEPGDLDQSGIRSDFESGLQGWGPRNGTDPVTVSTADNHTADGTKSLLTTAAGQYDGPLINALGKMHRNHQYDLSVWVKMAPGQAATSLRLSVQHGDSTYANVSANATVTDGAWVKLSGKFTLTNTPTVLNAYVETAANNGGPRSFYMDDFALTYVGPVDGPLPIQTDIPSMKDVYADSFPIGAAVTPEQLTGTHADLLKKHYNSLVAENAMKWDAIEPAEGQFNFAGGDAIRDFAVANGMEMRGHTLLWHQQTPDWVFKRGTADLTNRPADQELLLERLENHIKAVVEHFGTDLQTYDVVNEVIDPAQPDGFRRSKWFQILGKSYIDKAFEYARQYAPAGTKLVINDYSTTDVTKRQFLYDLVADLKERGIPVDGVGHQMHVDIQRPTADDIVQTLDMFAALGVENQVTELDVSVYTGAGNYDALPEDVGIELGHRYAELFDAFKQAKDNLTGVTLWGLGDDHTWLAGQNGHTNDYPLPFDARLQAKQAFWGIVDPSELDVLTKRQSVANGTPAAIDGEAELIWSTVSPLSIPAGNGSPLSATVKPLWDENHLYVYVDVTDAASDAGDAIDIYVDRNNGKTETYENDDTHYTLTRGRSEAADGVSYSVKERTGGYVIEASLPLDAAAMDQEIGFDLTVTDGPGDHSIAWNDVTFSQAADTSKYGVFEFIASSKTTDAVYGTPVIDGSPDSAWANANEVSTDVWVAGTSGSTAKVKTMWDAGHLYVYAVVTDSLLSKVSVNDHEKDSVEMFVDANNGKTASYQSDDGQYRVNYDNEQSYRGAANASNFTTATREVDGGYIVEAAIALDASLMKEGSLLGFDVQVNNDENGDGTRDSVAIWNDPTGNSWQNTSRFGVIRLTGGESSHDGGGGYVVIPSDSSKVENNTVKPAVRLEAGRAEAVLTGQALDQALKQAASDANGKKTAIVDIAAQSGANAYSVQLPAGSLNASSDSYSIALKTEFGVVELPSGMLAGMDAGSASTVSVRVSKASTEGLSPAVREQIGDRPFLNLEVLAGDQTLAWHNPATPVTVSIPYTPTAEERSNPDHILVWYIDGKGVVTPVPNARYDAELGVVRFETVHFSDYAVAYVEKSFGDLQSVPWAKQAIELMASRGIIKGTSDSAFAPAASIKRADFLALLVRALELKGSGKDAGAMFSDVEPSAYYYEEAKIAKELGIASGLGDNTFLPGGEISRQDMMVLTVQALKAAGKAVKTGDGGSLDRFSDASAVAGYAKESAAALTSAGIVNGSGGKLLPEAPLTRAQAAVILKAIWEM
ncbi:endo-1,4-beta-xylanase [Paenibacillus silvisoli]|uniref:endo-1,4-beta-xylanase n=1 Tax=Paenibacillus silvisoli TaxID=3110539 RepID=UPI00280427D5|nr:endo-1,4-beta-xylanase [Paenibacillus silvisoli]